ncbi:MAG: DUF3592 domain-containing protein [Pseudomonadota bacterium]
MRRAATALIVIALGAAGLYFHGQYDDQVTAVAKRSLSWPAVTGLITHSSLEAQRRARFRLAINYEYIVDDDRFQNDMVRFNQGGLSTAEMERLVSAYPVGRQVEVFYNPAKPAQSVLIRGSYP